jgi:hypothetical protein
LNDSFGNYSSETRCPSAKLARATGDVYAALWVYDTSFDIKTFLTIVELKPMESGLVTVNAASLASDVKPESGATLKEISKLLQQGSSFTLSATPTMSDRSPATWTSPSAAAMQSRC